MRKQRVFIAVLAGSNTVNVSLAQMAWQLPFISGNEDYPFRFGFQCYGGIRPQEYARNIICGDFLANDFDALMVIDEDMIFEGWNTLRVLETPDYDIAGVLQLMWDPGDPTKDQLPAIHPCAGVKHPELPYKMIPVYPNGQKVLPVDFVGSGCMVIKRRVLEDKGMLLAPGMDPPAFWRNVNEANGNRQRGMDVDFCYRAKDLGYRVRANFAASAGHHKRTDLNRVETYAKASFVQGFELGKKHALQVETVEGGAGQGADRMAPGAAGEPVASVGVDRAR